MPRSRGSWRERREACYKGILCARRHGAPKFKRRGWALARDIISISCSITYYSAAALVQRPEWSWRRPTETEMPSSWKIVDISEENVVLIVQECVWLVRINLGRRSMRAGDYHVCLWCSMQALAWNIDVIRNHRGTYDFDPPPQAVKRDRFQTRAQIKSHNTA